MVKKNSSELILPHLLGLFVGFLGPLITYLVSEEKLMKEHSREALNWQLSAALYSLFGVLLIIAFVGILVLIAVVICNAIFCIIAAVRASEGKLYVYPLTIPFIKGDKK
jgi:uncharacterized Tic20 family protein